MAQAVEEWYKQMPIITRSYLTAAVVTTVGCSLEVRIFFLFLLFSCSTGVLYSCWQQYVGGPLGMLLREFIRYCKDYNVNIIGEKA
ncbi:hypothetical protein BHE74_00011465 [Ensete ventricosum]|nr:hypothetical protein BHE74_00011465 [Ensete ventricosum]